MMKLTGWIIYIIYISSHVMMKLAGWIIYIKYISSHVMMKLTGWIIYLAPIGVCFLIAGEILHMNSILGNY